MREKNNSILKISTKKLNEYLTAILNIRFIQIQSWNLDGGAI